MKRQVLYIHGGDSFGQQEDFLLYLKTVPLRDLPSSTSQITWKKNLQADLGEDYVVFMPSMPNKQNAQYLEWKIWFERYLSLIEGELILIGCSLGGMFLAKYLSEESLDTKVVVRAVFILAAPGGEYMAPVKDGDCSSFKFSASSAIEIAKKVQEIQVWHSEDDFVVPVAEAEWYRKYLPQAKIVIFKDKNHFLGPELPELIKEIKVFSS